MRRICFLIACVVLGLAATRTRAQEAANEPVSVPSPPEPQGKEATASAADTPATTSATTSVVPPPSATPMIMSASELAALGLDASAPAVDTSLQIGGFLDAGFGTTFVADNSFWRASGAVPSHSTFYVGNFNLYVRRDLTSFLRMLGEVRFSYLPNGSMTFGTEARSDTLVYDYTDFGRATRWGAIIIERAYVELTPWSHVNIRIGEFLTPFGVWNVDHGSPVVIPVRRPWSVGVGWFPRRQTGIELFGRLDSGDWGGGYHLTLSNGTGPVSAYADLDENKAVGGRLFLEYQRFGFLRLGTSAYYGRQTDASYNLALVGDRARSNETIDSQFDVLSWSSDLTWDLGEWHLQTEWSISQKAYTTKGRVLTLALGSRPVIPSDVLSWGGYGLLGYRLPWLGIMPFAMFERVSGELSYNHINLVVILGGVNVRPVDMLVFKATIERVIMRGALVEPLTVLQTQIAIAF